MINYTQNYFDIRLLKLSELKLHETTETYRLRNIYNRISKSKHLINPVIVGKHRNEYILIDGANRFNSLKVIGCKLAIAQIIEYNNSRIQLKNWNHLIYHFDIELVISYCKHNDIKFDSVSYTSGEKVLKQKLNTILATDLFKNETILVHFPRNFDSLLEELNKFVKIYFEKFTFDRTEGEINISNLKKFTRRKGTLIEFPRFKKSHIIRSANNKHKIPAGITRHILINRVLHVRYEIKNLLDEKDLVKKSKELEKYLISKIDDNKVRQYVESVIVFDE